MNNILRPGAQFIYLILQGIPCLTPNMKTRDLHHGPALPQMFLLVVTGTRSLLLKVMKLAMQKGQEFLNMRCLLTVWAQVRTRVCGRMTIIAKSSMW